MKLGASGVAGAIVTAGLKEWLKKREEKRLARENHFWPFKTQNASVEPKEQYFAAAAVGPVLKVASRLGGRVIAKSAKAAVKAPKVTGMRRTLNKVWDGTKKVGRGIDRASGPLMIGAMGASLIPQKQPEYQDDYYDN
jgi:hypothetical protein